MKVRDRAARVGCASNLRQLAIATHLYADAHRWLPSGCAYPMVRLLPQPLSGVGMSWQTAILPYIEQEQVWQLAWLAQRQDPYGHAPIHALVKAHAFPVLLCPSNSLAVGDSAAGDEFGLTDYIGVAGTGVGQNDGMFHVRYTVRLTDVKDGTSSTLMIGERPPGPRGAFGAWYAGWGYTVCSLSQILPAVGDSFVPPQASDCPLSTSGLRPGIVGNACDIPHFWSLYSGGANFAFADCSVRFVTYEQTGILPALATRSGGEVVDF